MSVTVSNTGDRKTNITGLFIAQYADWSHRKRNKPAKYFTVPLPAFGNPVPHVLEPKEQWSGGINHKAELIDSEQTGQLYAGVHHIQQHEARLQLE